MFVKEWGAMSMDNKQAQALNKLQSYSFAAFDLLLYLDTHPDDKSAFCMFRDLVMKSKELRAAYQKAYGPLTAFDSAMSDCFDWIDSPWPWEKEANY